jgi:hypothetical protein
MFTLTIGKKEIGFNKAEMVFDHVKKVFGDGVIDVNYMRNNVFEITHNGKVVAKLKEDWGK